MTLRHASFFSGVGGLDLGLERAGIKTVSLSEIDGYASAVLSERFPTVPNLGDITAIKAEEVPDAEIWSGGFPCQDLSVAGRRAGFSNGTRSVLAFTFLDLVERRRPRWLLLENVAGLLSSNRGRDFGRLLGEMVELGYGVSWRMLDARHFGVAQRRRRVFVVASLEDSLGDTGAERAAEVLAECEGGCGHTLPIPSSWQDATDRARGGASSDRLGGRSTIDESSPTLNASRDGAFNGVAGRLDDFPIVEGSMTGGGFDAPQSQRIYDARGQAPTLDRGKAIPQVFAFRKSARVHSATSPETWVSDGLANTLNNFDVGDVRTTHAIVGGGVEEDDRLPHKLDWNRYRCCGNGVVANVAEYIGRRLVAVDRKWRGGAK